MITHCSRGPRTIVVAASLAVALAGLAGGRPGAQAPSKTDGVIDRFTALVANMSGFGRPSTATIQIGIERWSTDAEREQLRTELVENGQDGLLRALQKLPRVGYIRTTSSIGWDLHYAVKTPLAGGGSRVAIGTDRPISFWEASRNTRTMDYPFTVIEMRIGRDGKGEGRMTLATKVTWDPGDKAIVLENWSTQPAHLLGVKEEPGGR